MSLLLLTALVASASAPPQVVVGGALQPRAELEAQALRSWEALDALWFEAVGQPAPRPVGPIRITLDSRPRRGHSGRSVLGEVRLRQTRPGTIDARMRLGLRHEIAHQFLWTVCEAASGDRLFHEAFALATSGEAPAWTHQKYVSVPEALRHLDQTRDLDSHRSRRAIARLVLEGVPAGGGLHPALVERLRTCAAGRRFGVSMRAEELADAPLSAAKDAQVVLSRHSGEILIRQGAIGTAMPFGSTLKPLVVAGHAEKPPRLEPDAQRSQWMCGEKMPESMGHRLALLRSCNGWFLDWGLRDPQVASFGGFGALLLALGMERLPEDMSEAIGVRTTLSLSPVAIARAYVAMAAARPDVLSLLRDNAIEGTLGGLEGASLLASAATKTGTLRDARSNPQLGWIVAVDDDVVVVVAKRERAPRSFADEAAALLARARRLPGIDAAQVQVFGLLPADQIEARCARAGIRSQRGGLQLLPKGWLPLAQLTGGAGSEAICLGAPFEVRFEGRGAFERHYPGVLRQDPAPAYRAPKGAVVTRKQRRARRGSDFVFRTNRLRYTAGVLRSEDASIRGEAREALARVIAHNAEAFAAGHRHAARPVCDTTHCQVYGGDAEVRDEERRALGEGGLPVREWLPFSKGGDVAWTEARALSEVSTLIGEGSYGLAFGEGRMQYVRSRVSGGGVIEEVVRRPCEILRSPLRLPACPVKARRVGDQVVFEGRGEGHGLGLDVEAAKRSGLDADALLRAAYDL